MGCEEGVLISGLVDGELDQAQLAQAKAHLEQCADCRALYQDLLSQQETMQMLFARENDQRLDDFEHGVYARLERRIGWVLLSIAATLLLAAGCIALVRDLIFNPELSLLVRISVPVGLVGLAVLGVSALRQRLTTLKHDPYREIER
ncbi:MAG: zf-HC2 domain-containing protein [Candidatus Alcyoniella australis]|nr:zf-HC2 domain-containing protein [Candidatus Alcyoniella australis]